jgi:hypothetical protein
MIGATMQSAVIAVAIQSGVRSDASQALCGLRANIRTKLQRRYLVTLPAKMNLSAGMAAPFELPAS